MTKRQRPHCINDAKLRRQIKQHSRTARSGATATVLTAHDPRETRAGGYGASGVQFVFIFLIPGQKIVFLSVHAPKPECASRSANLQHLDPPRRHADALRARLAALRDVAGADGNFYGELK